MGKLPKYVIFVVLSMVGSKSYVWLVKFSQLILSQGLTPCEMNPIVFWTFTSARCIILAVSVHDILKTRSNIISISIVKA